jgi:hypothetical protein
MEGVPDERGGVGEVAGWVSLRKRVVEGWWSCLPDLRWIC